MQKIYLPVTTNKLVLQNDVAEHGEFLLKSFGSFDFVSNILFDENKINYDSGYQNSVVHSSVFLKHLETVYKIIKQDFDKNSKLVEVGCGKGDFLQLVANDGYFHYEGYDKTYEGNDPKIKKRYVQPSDSIEADVVVIRHTLEHIKNPFSFLNVLKNVFSTKAKVFIEVPQFGWIKKHKLIYEFGYEHVNYFTTESLSSLFLNVEKKGDCFGGQYQYCLAKLHNLNGNEWCHYGDHDKWCDVDFGIYVAHFRDKIAKYSAYKRIWVWGGASKGVLFLNALKAFVPKVFDLVHSVIDTNPKKQGLFTPRTSVQVVSPEQVLKDFVDGDLVIVMNPNYFDEISDQIKKYAPGKVTLMNF